MIGLKTFAENLQTKLNNNLQGLTFAIKADSKKFDKALRIRNTVQDQINGLLTLQASDMSNLTSGELFATLACRLQIIFRLKGGVPDEDQEIIDPETKQVVDIIEGNYTYIEKVRDALSSAFQKNEQEVMTDSAGKKYLVCTLYQFVETGIRDQQSPIGDCMSFTAYISYMLVENGINTHDIVYTLDGNIIPFQTNTAYRSPTMDANVPAQSANGAAKNIASQSIFNISFQLPALQNDITRKMFKWLFSGELNVAHVLNIRYPNFNGTDFDESNYLVTYGENNASGETIKNIGQTMTLVECWDDYEIIGIPDNYYVYISTVSHIRLNFEDEAYFYVFSGTGYVSGYAGHAKKSETASHDIENGDYLMTTSPLSDTTGWTVVQNG